MPTPLRRRLRAVTAAILMTATAAWSPVMLLGMAAQPTMEQMAGMEHGPGSHKSGHPIECCALCPLTCAAPVVVARVHAAVPFPVRIVRIDASRARTSVPELRTARRLPFPVGPPVLRTA